MTSTDDADKLLYVRVSRARVHDGFIHSVDVELHAGAGLYSPVVYPDDVYWLEADGASTWVRQRSRWRLGGQARAPRQPGLAGGTRIEEELLAAFGEKKPD